MYYQDVEIGMVFKAESGKTITGSEIDLVAQLSGLDLPGFLDANVANAWGFRDRVTPGPYVLACMFGLMARQGFLSNAIWMGAEQISLKSPVFPGDKIYAEAEVLKKGEPKRGGGPVTYRFQVKNQDGKLIIEGISTCLFAGRP